jgi:RNA polymerase sigma-70 factor (ECF subfamily)
MTTLPATVESATWAGLDAWRAADSMVEAFAGLDRRIAAKLRRLVEVSDLSTAMERPRGTIPAARPVAARSEPRPMVTAAERSDETLLSDYLSGDRAAFAALVERYRRELHGFLARFLGSNAAADDVFQETFLQVHLAADTFDRARAFKPWLFTIAANKARDWHRRQKRRRALSLDAPTGSDAEGARMVDLMDGGAPAPDASLEGAEVRAQVKDVVDAMPAIYREVLQLNYFQRMSYQQISEVLGIPLGTVKSRIHAATATFADQWKSVVSRPQRTIPRADKESKA